MSLMEWARILFSGKPHFHIGGTERPYMLRWFLIPRNRFFNVYLHKFLRDDDDRALHDHPFAFVSIMLRGKYAEWCVDSVCVRGAGSIAFRRATHRHRIELPKRADGSAKPCWTLVITGPRVREWGFSGVGKVLSRGTSSLHQATTATSERGVENEPRF